MSTSTVKEVLIAARKKVEQGWTKGAWARDINDASVDPSSSTAMCWCVTGALLAVSVSRVRDYEAAWEAFYSAIDAAYMPRTIVAYNDREDCTQAEVLTVFDRAIAAQGDA